MKDTMVKLLPVLWLPVVEGSEHTELCLFPPPLADPASMANVQKESFVLAATHSRC